MRGLAANSGMARSPNAPRALAGASCAALLLAALLAAGAGAADVEAYWREARDVRPGVKLKTLAFAEPRLMKAYLLRVDLATPGIGFTATERDPRWGEPMPDYTNGVKLIRTRRETTVDFMLRRRAAGVNVEVAVNTAPWSPFCPPWTHRWADPGRWIVSDGVVVSPGREPGAGALFVVRKSGRAEIVRRVPAAETNDVAFAMSGFSIIATNGVAIGRDSAKLAPRTAFGLSADRRYLFLLALDGRQTGYSLGANMGDLCRILLPAGAADAINMDGGGSTSLVVFDRAAGMPRMLNHHALGQRRPVAVNFGITFGD